ncbi:hypothetical protein L1049_012248 [Liquidambar formosana]|uniref:Anaphase-promoting complex subunit 4-like WD40 domain-containing protein n=1 Tax=Liquidambar formosana TaxID=63359 RepID=A0AAP0X3X3_LIQFO
MFAKRLFHKATDHPHQRSVMSTDLDPRVTLHYGIPSTASILALDPIQRILAIGTLDGRIKVLGGDTIESLLISPKQLPFKNLEFLHNQGFLASVSNENDIQVWDMEHRRMACTLQWESNITAFSVIFGTVYMYIGDEFGTVSVLKYDAEEGKIIQMPYQLPANFIAETAGILLPNHHSVVGVLPQPCSHGNRLLIAYENGLIILWDVSEDGVVLVRGNKDLQLKETVVDSESDVRPEISDDMSDQEQEEKEISSLCWASSNGSILAVGYVDGDIMLWNLSTAAPTKDQKADKSSNNVVKLQLSSGNRRLPVIVLRWSANRSFNDSGGHLFVYGGDEIGSDEVLTGCSQVGSDRSWGSSTIYPNYQVNTILTHFCPHDRAVSTHIPDRIDGWVAGGWAYLSGHADLTLNGSFADTSLLPNAGAIEISDTSSLFVLTSPGQLHVYDDACLSTLMSQQEKKASVPAMQYPMVIPTVEPCMTVGKLALVYTDEKFSRALSEIVSTAKVQVAHTLTTRGAEWPLTGGVPSPLSYAEENGVERVFVAGYQDGSVRIWDATYPALLLIFVLESEVKGIKIAGASASISALDFCSVTLNLVIGNEYGLVHLYKLIGSSAESSFHYVTETEHEVHNLHQGNGAKCSAVFSLLNSPIRTLRYANFGTRLAVGFECGRVAMLDTSSLSVLFLTDLSSSSSPVISLALKSFSDTNNMASSLEDSESKSSNDPGKGVTIILSEDANVVVIDSATGNTISSWSVHPKKGSTAISLYIIEGNISVSEVSSEKHSLNLSQNSEDKNEPPQTSSHCGSNQLEVEVDTSTETMSSGQSVLFCCEDALCLYSLKSVIQGDNNSIRKVDLVKPCCWTTTFNKDEKEGGLVVLYPTGVIEIRSSFKLISHPHKLLEAQSVTATRLIESFIVGSRALFYHSSTKPLCNELIKVAIADEQINFLYVSLLFQKS